MNKNIAKAKLLLLMIQQYQKLYNLCYNSFSEIGRVIFVCCAVLSALKKEKSFVSWVGSVLWVKVGGGGGYFLPFLKKKTCIPLFLLTALVHWKR